MQALASFIGFGKGVHPVLNPTTFPTYLAMWHHCYQLLVRNKGSKVNRCRTQCEKGTLTEDR